MNKIKLSRNKTRHAFLLTLFPDKKKTYAVLEMNNFVLVRQKGIHGWEVAIYTKENWEKVSIWKIRQPITDVKVTLIDDE